MVDPLHAAFVSIGRFTHEKQENMPRRDGGSGVGPGFEDQDDGKG